MRAPILFMICCLISSASFADAMIDFGAIYTADTLNTTTSSGNTQYFYNMDLLFNLDHSAKFNVGWTVFGISQVSTAASVETTYSSMDMGPALRWNIDKGGMFSLTLAYGYLAKGNYSSGSTEEEWEGTSYFGQFAVQLPVQNDKFYIGLSLNYYGANYTQKTVSMLESATSVQKTWIFPMIGLTWRP